jgi:hypothetical protein
MTQIKSCGQINEVYHSMCFISTIYNLYYTSSKQISKRMQEYNIL